MYHPTNARLQRVTGEHPKDITVVLQALVRDGLLTQQNQRRWASYRVAGDTAMVREGLLDLRYPEVRNRPDQAYRSIPTQ